MIIDKFGALMVQSYGLKVDFKNSWSEATQRNRLLKER